MDSNVVKIAAAQISSPLLDSSAATQRACEVIGEAGSQGIQLIAFSEGFLGGHPDWLYFMPGPSPEAMHLGAELIKTAILEDGPEVQRLGEAACEARTAVVIGAAIKDRASSGTIFNALLFFDDRGVLQHVHRKLVPTTTERLCHGPGDASGLRAMSTSFGRVTGLVCGENSNALARFVCATEEPVVHVASWSTFFSPTSACMPQVADAVGRSLAYELGAYVISCTNVWNADTVKRLGLGPEALRHAEDVDRVGGSAIYGPKANVIARAKPGNSEELVVADVDKDVLWSKKLVHDFAGHYNRPDVFKLSVDRTRPAIVMDSSEAG